MKYIKIIMLLAAIALFSFNLNAQDATKLEIKAIITGTNGEPLSGVTISSDESRNKTVTDNKGEFSFSTGTNDILTARATGYQTQRIFVDANLKTITLVPNEDIVNIAFTRENKADLQGGVSYLNVPELLEKNYFTYSLDNLSSLVNGFHGNIWGNSSYLVLVDGVPRDANNVLPTEIDQITVLKGTSAVALYGSRAAKGVVLISTKRGEAHVQDIKVRVNTGINVPKIYPEYLGSAEYMTLYNEARENDGLTPLYSDETIYNFASGKNPYRYPNVDYYSSDYLRKVSNRSDVVTEFVGGNDVAKFYTNIGFVHDNSLLNVGEGKNDNNTRLNIRGNIDVKLSDYITSKVNANATFYDARSAFGDYWSNASTIRPNRYTPLIPISYIEGSDAASWLLVENSANIIDGQYLLGGTQLDQTNPFASMYAGGYNKYTSRQFQFDALVDFNLSGLLKGLSFSTQFGVDYSNTYNQSYNNSYAVYEPVWTTYNGVDVINHFNKYGEDKKSGVQNLSGSWQRQTLFFSGQFNYKNTFSEVHNLSAILLAHGYQQSESTIYHRTSNANLGFQASYNYANKYYAGFTSAVVHSAKLAPGKRTAFSPNFSLAYRISQEGFMADIDAIDELKITASAGILNTDLDVSDYYLYKEKYTQGDGTWWGWKEGVSLQSTDALRGGNNELTFAQKKELSFGVESSLFNNLITVDANYFVGKMDGLTLQATNLYPSYFYTYYPVSSFIPYVNYNNDERGGFDFSVYVNKNVKNVEFKLGVIGTYYYTKASKRSEIYENAYQYREGKPIDAIFGLQSDGFFMDQADIDNHESQTFGDVKPGDIKYVDQNNDGVIDSKDEIYLGRGGWYGSPFTLGVNLSAKWNNFTFYVLANGGFGSYGTKNSSYYWVYGDRKYSAVVRDRWTESTKETATYPRLTTLSGDNNFRTSDFWLYKNNRFNIAKVQISYDLPKQLIKNWIVKEMGFYVSGSNLLTISKEREVMEMNIGSSPQTRFYNMGMKVVF